ncbi:CLUMA_CG009867, isoform A [Clunio marinus]|uniref:oligopeptidase A n=1 Tax=Clunio marinus TaxID=568069 RepID=A0A1J1I8X8_9DIPT|nr:CLUMA_CG009867, isoform A [Clunio marinus]
MSYLKLLKVPKQLLLTRTTQLISHRNSGFIVLVPEIGEDLNADKNPLIGENDLPEFSSITIEKCVGVVGTQGLIAEKKLRELEESLTEKTEIKDVFTEVFNPLEEISSPLDTTWGLSKTLYLGNSTLMPTKSYLTIHDRARRVRVAKFFSQPIHLALKAAQNKKASTEEYDDSQKRLINKYLLEASLNGIELEGASRYQLMEVFDKLNQERSKFQGKLKAARRHFKQNCNDPKIIKEFPLNLLQAISVDPKAHPTKGPWRITLEPFIVKEFMKYCPDHHLRWNVWQADVRKCSTQQEKAVETSTNIEEIRFLRRQQAKLLGYKSFMDMSMETKMAGSMKTVTDTLGNLLDIARPSQESEIAGLQEFAEKLGFHKKLEIQDVPYYRRLQLEEVHGFDQEVIKEYFPLNKVLVNMFSLAEKLFNIKINERSSVNRWHENVKFFDIFDLETGGKEPVGGFYVDLFARDDEKLFEAENNGWMVAVRSKCELTKTKPLAALIFNFKKIPDKPLLLSIEDVQMLFNKFGHSLQHLLCKSIYSELSGLTNVEWDAVEIGGNVMTNLIYNENILRKITAHYSNNDPLPEKLISAVMNQQKHLSGFSLCRELYLSALDIELHQRKDFWLEIIKELYPRYHVFPLDKKDAHPCSFEQIFGGEWGGAYFSHVWAKLVAADVYSAFFEANKSQNEEEFIEVGKRFRNTFLTYGGNLHPSEVFRRFRGRDPSPKALLKSLGLIASKNIESN